MEKKGRITGIGHLSCLVQDIRAMRPLYFRIEPLNGPQLSVGMFLVVWPEAGGNGRWCHHAHPDRTVIDAQAGDVLVHKRRQYRMLAVQRFNDWHGPWFDSVAECVDQRRDSTPTQ